MASPQKENGHIDIANEIAEKLAQINLSKYEWRFLWALWRKTWGWHKKMDSISISQFENMMLLDRRNVSRTKRNLLQKNIITESDGLIGFNKNYDTWNIVSIQTIANVVYRDTRPKWFPPPGYQYKSSEYGLCEYCCQEKKYRKEGFEVHHILPKKLGGKEIKENRANLCYECHSYIHKEIDEFFCVSPDDIQGCYRHFVSKLSSLQTTFLSSLQTTTKEKKETIQKKKREQIPYHEIVAIYHEILPELPRVAKLTETRKKQLRARWKEREITQDLDWWRNEFFAAVRRSKFLMGENSRNWKPDLEWLTKESNFIKVIEGKYEQ
jgi:phage replication O-like protein O